jgi:flagellar biosynthesis GTPase FlhF
MSTPGAALLERLRPTSGAGEPAAHAPADTMTAASPSAAPLATATTATSTTASRNPVLQPAPSGDASQSRIFQGRSIEELIPRIQAELGGDAIVLRRRTGLTGGIGGFFQRPFAEVEAKPGGPRIDLYDENPGTPVLPDPNASADPYLRGPGHRPARPGGAYVTDDLAALANSNASTTAPGQADAGTEPEALMPTPFEPEAATPFEPEAFMPLATEPESRMATPAGSESFTAALAAAELEMFEPLEAELQRLQPSAPAPGVPTPGTSLPAVPTANASTAAVPTPGPVRTRARTSIESTLMNVGMSEEFVCELIDMTSAHVLALAPRLSLARAVHRGLVQSIPVAAPLPAASASVAIVGCGGSGKTTACAALLAAYRKSSTLRASCATIVPDEEGEEPSLLLSPVVMTPTPLSAGIAQRALADARAQGLLLLDTPTLSPGDRTAIRGLTALLGGLAPDRIVVALPATLSAKAAAQMLEAFAPLGASAVAITHADETDQLGVAVEAACRFGLAPEYIVDRNRARGRLVRIDPTYLADKLLP